MVAELRNGTEDCSAVAKATTSIAVALDKGFHGCCSGLFLVGCTQATEQIRRLILWWTGCSGGEPTLVLEVPLLFTLSPA